MFTAPNTVDVTFTVACAAVVFLMQAGFCLLESGLVRTKNSINVAVKNVLDSGIAILSFTLVGFALMFGTSRGGWIGDTNNVSILSDPKTTSFFLFQMVFCSTAATIVSGAVAERIRLWVYVSIAALLSGVIYPTFGHWAWGGALTNTRPGWLASAGFVDYAGCVVVHVIGGSAALAAARAVGRRRHIQRRDVTGGHSLTLSILGCFLIWFGWWGFNGGSGLAAGDSLPMVLLNTNLGAVAGGLTAAILTLARRQRIEVIPLINGILAGLVSVTGACHAIGPESAVAAGIIGGLVCLIADRLVAKIGIDDAIGAFAVHGAAGVWGAVVFAIFAPTAMLLEGSRIAQLRVQLGGALLAGVMSYVAVLALLTIIRQFTALRVRAGEERMGLNMAEHGATNEVVDLLSSMQVHETSSDYSRRLQSEAHTEVGQIAAQYNRVLDRVESEITNHQVTNASLEQERLRLRSVLENAGVGIYQVAPSGEFLSANATLLEVLDCPDASWLLDAEHTSFPPWHEDNNELAKLFRHAFEEGRELRSLENLIISRRGVERWVLESFVPIRDESGRLICYLGTLQDVTDRKQAMLAEVEIAEAKSQAKGEFLANMSHEIRTPLNGVIGMLDLMCTLDLDGRANHYATVARSSADTLLSLVNDILDFSKIEAGKLELEQIEFDLRDLIERTAEQFAVMAHGKGLDMNCEISEEIASPCIGDPERLRQVIINLLGNAVKFTQAGEINLRVLRRGDQIRVAVQDTGIGMRPEILGKLFESFTQADASTTRQHGGTGLGLTISSQLVSLMGGTIQVESVEGEGSTFWFEVTLPSVDTESTCTTINQQLASLPSGMRVLVVDDNTTNCEILSAQLSMWGLEVSICQQATSAVERMIVAHRLEKPFHLVVLDFCMPDLDGEQVARLINDRPELRRVPILMLSSNHTLLETSQLHEAGIDIALTKPARQSRLLDAVTTLLHGIQTDAPSGSMSQVLPSLATNRGSRSSEQDAPVREVRQVVPDGEETPPEAAANWHSTAAAAISDVLVAEDNEVNQLVIAQMLSRLGLRAEIVGDGQQAVDRLKEQRYQLILMDLHMPVLDGLSATRTIRKWEEASGVTRTPIFALTANVVAGVRQECVDAGMDGFLCKPITLSALEAAIAELPTRGYEKRHILAAGNAQRHDSALPAVDSSVTSSEPATREIPLPHPSPVIDSSSRGATPPTAHDWQSEFVPAETATVSYDESDDAARLAKEGVTALPSSTDWDSKSSDDPAPASGSTPPVEGDATDKRHLLDREQLNEMCGGDQGFAIQILKVMRDSLPERRRELETAHCDGDLARVRAVAHKLKGAAGDSSLVAVYECAAALERSALDRNTEAVSPSLETLRVRIDQTFDYLNSLLDASS